MRWMPNQPPAHTNLLAFSQSLRSESGRQFVGLVTVCTTGKHRPTAATHAHGLQRQTQRLTAGLQGLQGLANG
jgi:hypothetical protein